MGACCTCIVKLFKNNKDYGEVNTDPRDVLVIHKSKRALDNHILTLINPSLSIYQYLNHLEVLVLH